MFGRKAVLPIDLDTEKSQPEAILQKHNSEDDMSSSHVMKAAAKHQGLLDSAKSNIARAQQKQKEQYDRKRCKPGIHCSPHI